MSYYYFEIGLPIDSKYGKMLLCEYLFKLNNTKFETSFATFKIFVHFHGCEFDIIVVSTDLGIAVWVQKRQISLSL